MPPRSGHLREPEALHALAHPLRVRILEQLREPASAAELAPRLRQSRQNVNYHLKELERGGLVRRVGSRRSGALTETLYQAQADSVVVAAGGPVALADCDTAVAEDGELLPAGRWHGVVHSLHIAAAAGGPVESVEQVRVVTERGLEGDRYFDGTGTFSKKPGAGRHVTLIELEAIRALHAERGVLLDPGAARRNIVTCGVPPQPPRRSRVPGREGSAARDAPVRAVHLPLGTPRQRCQDRADPPGWPPRRRRPARSYSGRRRDCSPHRSAAGQGPPARVRRPSL